MSSPLKYIRENLNQNDLAVHAAKTITFSASCQQLTAYIAAVPNEALTASAEGFSSDGYNFGPENSRLFARNNATHAGGWVAAPETSETFHYIQVGEVQMVALCT